MAYKKTADALSEVSKSVSELVDIVRGVAERVSSLEGKKEEPKVESKAEAESLIDLPDEHKKLLLAVLNQKFGAKVESAPDPTVFRFIIYVPKEYSPASDGHWSMYHEDARIVMVERASSEASIKKHIERVFESFDKSIQALIVADRV